MRIDPIVILVLPVFLLSVIVHETAHGLMALWCGDTTARDRGRLTLNPLPHVDLVGSILLPGLLFLFHSPVLFGWAKPVPIDWSRLRNPRNDTVRVALAGPAANALLALTFAALARLVPDAAAGSGPAFFAPLREIALVGVVWNCALGLFNLIPIVPLDGSWVLMRFLAPQHAYVLAKFRLLGLALVMILFSLPFTSKLLFITPLRLAVRTCLGLFGLPAAGVV